MTEERLLAIEAELNEDVSWRDQADRGDLAWELLTALQQLRTGIEGLRREHTDIPIYVDDYESCSGGPNCECGAGAYNQAIDDLLQGGR